MRVQGTKYVLSNDQTTMTKNNFYSERKKKWIQSIYKMLVEWVYLLPSLSSIVVKSFLLPLLRVTVTLLLTMLSTFQVIEGHHETFAPHQMREVSQNGVGMKQNYIQVRNFLLFFFFKLQ
jgi:hypothetical protein